MEESSETAESPTRGHEYRGKRAASNSAFATIGVFVVLVIALVTTPITLNKLGVVEFGIWTFATAVIGYITIIDPGFSDLVTRYGAQARVRGETHVAARICALGSLVWIGFGLIFAPGVYYLSPIIVEHLHDSPGVTSVATTFFYWAFGLVIFSSLQATLSARLSAVGDQWMVTVIDASTRVIYAVVLIYFLYHGWRLSAIVAATTTQYVLAYVATIILVSVRAGVPYANPLRLERHHLREISHFGGWLQFGSLLETLTYETDPLVIGTLVGPTATGLWAISNRVARQVTLLAYQPQTSVLPAISASYTADASLNDLRRIYVRAQRIIVLIGVFMAGFIIAFGPVLMELWLGKAYLAADTAIILATLAMAAGLPRPVTANAILAMGRVGYGVRAQMLAFVVNAILTLSLVEPYGLRGVLIGTVAAKVVATTYLLLRFSRLVDSTFRVLIWPWLRPLLFVTTIVTVIGRLLLGLWPSAQEHRLQSLLATLVFGLVFSALFAIGLRLSRYFTGEDLRWMRSVAPGKSGAVITPTVVRLLTGTRA